MSSEFAASIENVTDTARSPLSIASSSAVTVTVCGVSQFAGVKVNELTSTLNCDPSALATRITTGESGCASSVTVTVSVAPSVAEPLSMPVVDPSLSTIVKPTTSSSVVATSAV